MNQKMRTAHAIGILLALFILIAMSGCPNEATDYAFDVPFPPESVRAAWSSDDDAVKVTWSYAGDLHEGWVVERSAAAVSGFEEIAAARTNDSQYLDPALSTDGAQLLEWGMTYYYRIKTTNTEGSSEFSSVSEAVTLPGRYTVTYWSNGADGGEVPAQPQLYPDGAAVIIADNTGTLTRTGYAFAGWNGAADGDDTNYAPGNSFTIESADVDLYALWVSGTVEATITVSNPTEPSFSMSPKGFTIETGGGTTQTTVSASAADVTISAYEWFVNGTSRGSASSITFDTTTNLSWFEYGVNQLTLVVVIDGVPYSERFTFRMEQH